jgi:hypothetical protein
MGSKHVEIGDYVVVEVFSPNHLLPALFPNAKSSMVYEGEVMRGAGGDPQNSFRMTGNKDMPVRVIAWKNVLKLNDEPYSEEPITQENKTFRTKISGSKGSEYTVEIDPDGNGTCPCKGFTIRRHCSHIDAARTLLKEQK